MGSTRLLLLMTLVFSVVLLLQYYELPYGYVLSSLLSFSKSQVTYGGNLSNQGSSNSPESLGNQMFINGSSSTEMNDVHESLNAKNVSDGDNAHSGHDLKSDITISFNETSGASNYPVKETWSKDVFRTSNNLDVIPVRNESLGLVQSRDYVHGLNYTTANNSSLHNLLVGEVPKSSSKDEGKTSQFTTQVVFAPFSSPEPMGANGSDHAIFPYPNASAMSMRQNSESSELTPSDLSSSTTRNPITKKRFKGPPSVVVPISSMNDMLYQSIDSYRSVKPVLYSQADQQLLNAKASIQNAQIVKKDPKVDVNIYRNYSAFIRSYEIMEKTLKIYIYAEGERPIFHQPELHGIYASEGWFMKLLEENRHFVTKNADRAHLFYMPFSSWILEKVLYVPDSHSWKNLVQYMSSYLQNITTTHPFWNRTDGADHFLVACHDWAPGETSRIMKNCIRALCNADVKGRFRFGKDVSLPETYVRVAQNPLKDLGGKSPSQRQILAFFAGKMHGYLRPILLNHWENKDPDMKIFGKLSHVKDQMNYVKYMKSSKYCISARGYEAYTPRIVEAIFYECVPVIVSDNYVPPFFETMNWESFAVFVLEKDIPNLKNILQSISQKRYLEMQQRVKQVQKHFLWHKTPVKYDIFHMILHSIWYTRVFQMKPG